MTWQDRAPAMLVDPNGPDGARCPTPTDRRWLWRIEQFLAINGRGDLQHELQRDLAEYLNETCEHYWLDYEADSVEDAHRQCVWCHRVEWTAETSK